MVASEIGSIIKSLSPEEDGLQVLYGDKKSRMSGTTSLDAQKWKRIGMKMGCGTREEK
ncbi:hypothetical protein MTR_5g093330 [Medicago truncatula]|uniref:Uncharacterized protein n=1 Tax=Medicago truncatula TaxID=3880 RepID=G7K3M1_MEDTR|nr:hypothetical protein MTR_5g093330 [Medicago truncatula]